MTYEQLEESIRIWAVDNDWADPRALVALPQLFAPFELEATAQALRDMLKLVAWMAEETAVYLHHPYPTASIDQVHNWIESTLKDIA